MDRIDRIEKAKQEEWTDLELKNKIKILEETIKYLKDKMIEAILEQAEITEEYNLNNEKYQNKIKENNG